MSSESVSVVSGGTSGIGLAVAQRFGAEGGRVAVLGRGNASLDEARKAILAAGASEVLALVVDATDDAQVATAFSAIGEQWGAVNALVNTVGPPAQGGFGDLDDGGWFDAFDAGVLSAVRTVRHGLPWIRKASWGRIVNVTAMSVKHQNPRLIAYTASKAALASVTKNLARTLAPDGILVNAVAPGAVLTDAITSAVNATGVDGRDPVAAYAMLEEHFGLDVDLKRVGMPNELAEVICFCASASNTYMTGAHLNVDGGSDFA